MYEPRFAGLLYLVVLIAAFVAVVVVGVVQQHIFV